MTACPSAIPPHIIWIDQTAYSPSPLLDVQNHCSKERPIATADLLGAIDDADTGKSAISHSSTCYRYRNSHFCDSPRGHEGKFAAVGSVDFTTFDAHGIIRSWIIQGLTGLRQVTGGFTKPFETSELRDQVFSGTADSIHPSLTVAVTEAA